MQIRKLRADEIETKVKQVVNGGAYLLLYKNARTDMAILDETFGPMNWQNDYKNIDEVLYCGIGIREDSNSLFVWKWSNGIESRKDAEGNQVKGEASDAFKRAGFCVGIGRELYTAPTIKVSVPTRQDGKTYKMDGYYDFTVKRIAYTDTGTISELEIVDQNGALAFKYPRTAKSSRKVQVDDFSDLSGRKINDKPETIDEDVINDIWYYAQEANMTDKVIAWISKKFGKQKVEALTLAEANELIAALCAVAEGKRA